MGIYIKDMEMPEDCPMCPLSHWNAGGNFTGCEVKEKHFSEEEMQSDSKPDFCPLIELPPHGRLIDADVLINFLDIGHLRHPSELSFSEIEVANLILHAPTIIPAEEGEG